jgi:hypothetical protein
VSYLGSVLSNGFGFTGFNNMTVQLVNNLDFFQQLGPRFFELFFQPFPSGDISHHPFEMDFSALGIAQRLAPDSGEFLFPVRIQ